MSPFIPSEITEDVMSEGRQGRTVVPAGYYLVEVAAVKPSDPEHDGYGYLDWRLRIKEGAAGISKQFRYTTSTNPKSIFSLGAMLFYALGEKDAPEKQTKIKGYKIENWNKLNSLAVWAEKATKGKKMVVLVADGAYEGKPTSEIQEFYLEKEWEELNGAPTVAVAPIVPAAAKPNGKAAPSPIDELDDDFGDGDNGEDPEPESEIEEAPKRGRGRPKGSTKAAPAPAAASAVVASDPELDDLLD